MTVATPRVSSLPAVPDRLARFVFADELTAAERSMVGDLDDRQLADLHIGVFLRWLEAVSQWSCPPGHPWCREPDCAARRAALDRAHTPFGYDLALPGQVAPSLSDENPGPRAG